MYRFRVEYCLRGDWCPGAYRDEQRWSTSGTVFTGSFEDAILEQVELEELLDAHVRLLPLPSDPLPGDCTCLGCGGDTRAPAGARYACDCAPGIARAPGVATAEGRAS